MTDIITGWKDKQVQQKGFKSNNKIYRGKCWPFLPMHIHTKNKCKMKFEMTHKQNQVEEKYGLETKEAIGA